MYKKDKALEAYRNCLKCKEIIYPKDSQELIRPLMQILRLSSENDESLEPVEIGQRVNGILNTHINKIDNDLVMNSGNFSDEKKSEIE